MQRVKHVVELLFRMRGSDTPRELWIQASEAYLALDEDAERHMVWIECLQRLALRPPALPPSCQVSPTEWLATCRRQLQWLHGRLARDPPPEPATDTILLVQEARRDASSAREALEDATEETREAVLHMRAAQQEILDVRTRAEEAKHKMQQAEEAMLAAQERANAAEAATQAALERAWDAEAETQDARDSTHTLAREIQALAEATRAAVHEIKTTSQEIQTIYDGSKTNVSALQNLLNDTEKTILAETYKAKEIIDETIITTRLVLEETTASKQRDWEQLNSAYNTIMLLHRITANSTEISDSLKHEIMQLFAASQETMEDVLIYIQQRIGIQTGMNCVDNAQNRNKNALIQEIEQVISEHQKEDATTRLNEPATPTGSEREEESDNPKQHIYVDIHNDVLENIRSDGRMKAIIRMALTSLTTDEIKILDFSTDTKKLIEDLKLEEEEREKHTKAEHDNKEMNDLIAIAVKETVTEIQQDNQYRHTDHENEQPDETVILFCNSIMENIIAQIEQDALEQTETENVARESEERKNVEQDIIEALHDDILLYAETDSYKSNMIRMLIMKLKPEDIESIDLSEETKEMIKNMKRIAEEDDAKEYNNEINDLIESSITAAVFELSQEQQNRQNDNGKEPLDNTDTLFLNSIMENIIAQIEQKALEQTEIENVAREREEWEREERERQERENAEKEREERERQERENTEEDINKPPGDELIHDLLDQKDVECDDDIQNKKDDALINEIHILVNEHRGQQETTLLNEPDAPVVSDLEKSDNPNIKNPPGDGSLFDYFNKYLGGTESAMDSKDKGTANPTPGLTPEQLAAQEAFEKAELEKSRQRQEARNQERIAHETKNALRLEKLQQERSEQERKRQEAVELAEATRIEADKKAKLQAEQKAERDRFIQIAAEEKRLLEAEQARIDAEETQRLQEEEEQRQLEETRRAAEEAEKSRIEEERLARARAPPPTPAERKLKFLESYWIELIADNRDEETYVKQKLILPHMVTFFRRRAEIENNSQSMYRIKNEFPTQWHNFEHNNKYFDVKREWFTSHSDADPSRIFINVEVVKALFHDEGLRLLAINKSLKQVWTEEVLPHKKCFATMFLILYEYRIIGKLHYLTKQNIRVDKHTILSKADIVRKYSPWPFTDFTKFTSITYTEIPNPGKMDVICDGIDAVFKTRSVETPTSFQHFNARIQCDADDSVIPTIDSASERETPGFP